MKSSANVVDLSETSDSYGYAVSERTPPAFRLVVTPHPESQVGTFDDVISASFELCHSIGKQHRVDRRNKMVLVLVCAANKNQTGVQCPYRVGATRDGPDRVRIHTMR